MITKDEKRFLAFILAIITFLATVLTTGLTVHAKEKPISIEYIKIGNQYETDVEAGKDIQKYLLISEETGTYQFYSTGNDDTYGYIFDENQQLISSDNDSGENLNFSMNIHLESGKKYYLAVGYFIDNQSGTIQWKIEPASSEKQKEKIKNDISTEAKTQEVSTNPRKVSIQSNLTLENGLEYSILDDGTIEVTGYTGDDKNLVIPNMIDDKAVSSIGKEAFFENKKIENVTIPKNVTSLQYQSFASCENLKNISFVSESKLKTIEDGVFYEDKNLNEIICPQNLKSIGNKVFLDCVNLSKAELNDGLESIGIATFCNSGIKEIDIKDSVTNLGHSAFAYCKELQNVKLEKRY